LDPRLRREPLAERAHVAVPERLALERAEEHVPTGQAEPLPTFEPAGDGVGCVRREWGGGRLVGLAVEHAGGVARGLVVVWGRGGGECGVWGGGGGGRERGSPERKSTASRARFRMPVGARREQAARSASTSARDRGSAGNRRPGLRFTPTRRSRDRIQCRFLR